MPLHSTKKEVRGHLSWNSIQASYSVSDNMFVAASFFKRTRRDSWGTGKEHGGGRLGYEKSSETYVAIGYFKPYNAWHFEVLGGAGIGSLQYRNELDLHPEYLFSLNCRKNN